MKIIGFTEHGPIAGKVIRRVSAQYPGQNVSYFTEGIDGYEGWIDEGSYIEFDQKKWDYIVNEWNKILEARKNIQDILNIQK